MKIQKEQKGTSRILLLEGRLDADAAATLSPYLGVDEDEKTDSLIIDLSRVQYLSSGGIRALHSAYKAWKNRGGKVILTGVGEFPKKVLAMSGFDRVFLQYPTVDDALQSINTISSAGDVSSDWESHVEPQAPDIKISTFGHSRSPSRLFVSGRWDTFFLSSIKPEDLVPVPIGPVTWQHGIGSFGTTSPGLSDPPGYYIRYKGMIAWSTPGLGSCDFLWIPDYHDKDSDKDTSNQVIPGFFSACSAGLEGSPEKVFMVEPVGEDHPGFTLDFVLRLIRNSMQEPGDSFHGLYAVTFIADVLEYESEVLQISPGIGQRTDNRESVYSGENYPHWFNVERKEAYPAETVIGFGYLLDPSMNRSQEHDGIEILFPGITRCNGVEMCAGLHGISVERFAWQKDSEIDSLEGEVIGQAEFKSVYHLLPNSRVQRILIGISAVNEIQSDKGPVITLDSPVDSWNEDYEEIVRQLNPDAALVRLNALGGGYSGSLVFKASVTDKSGREQMPFVIKLGPWPMISDETKGYREHVERYILNSSTRLIEFRKVGKSGGILYNFVGSGGPGSHLESLEQFYRDQPPMDVEEVFHRLFRNTLVSWYGQPTRQDLMLYREYGVPLLYDRVRQYAMDHFRADPDEKVIELPCNLGKSINPLYFIEHVVPERGSVVFTGYVAPQHGDLNLNNILVDERENMWLIDFSETRITHNLRDIAKMETVVRTELLPLESDVDVCNIALLDAPFIGFKDLSHIPGIPAGDLSPAQEKAFRIIRTLRYYADHVTVLDTLPEPYLIELLGYTLAVLWYVSVGEHGKKFAWITASRICSRLL